MKEKHIKKNRYWLFGIILFIAFSACSDRMPKAESSSSILTETEMKNLPLTYLLPSPKTDGSVSVEKALSNRRSQRNFQDRELSTDQLSQILWAAYGVTRPMPEHPSLKGGLRTAPSAGAMYPFEIYAVAGKVKGIESGVYKYIPHEHKITRTIDKDIRVNLSAAALGQTMIRDAPVTIVYSAVFSRMTSRYGERGRERYVCIDLGHSAQNIYLQTEALRLGTCAIGAFTDSKVSQTLQLPAEEEPLYLMPVGY